MKFSVRTVYGIKAILVLAGRFGEGSLSVSRIAGGQGISTAYLEQILNGLKKKGLVESARGPRGGYRLAQKPSDIRLDDLFRALEGNNFFTPDSPPPVPSAADETAIANFIFWKKFESILRKELSAVTLKQVVDEARRLKNTKSGPRPQVFHI